MDAGLMHIVCCKTDRTCSMTPFEVSNGRDDVVQHEALPVCSQDSNSSIVSGMCSSCGNLSKNPERQGALQVHEGCHVTAQVHSGYTFGS